VTKLPSKKPLQPDEVMRLALAQARRGEGRVFPNPSVGAVVFRGGRVLGRGHTRPPGGPHAEVVAMEAVRRRHGARALRGASLAVTLEPCCFTGRTGPCTEAAIEAGIRRVLVGVRDPHARVRGRGIRRLRAAGIDVETGILEEQCREHHRGFFSLCERGRPFVIVKLASTLDGRIATATGESRWITGPAAREHVHRLRARVDAVMVGSGTALADDPALTARRGGRIVHRPVRVLVDSKLRLRPGARMFQTDPERTWVLCPPRARGRGAVESTGARLVDVPRRGGHLDLEAGLLALGDAGLTSLLVEGGGGLAAALLRGGLADEIHWYLAPTLIGGDGRAALASLGVRALGDAHQLEDLRVRRVGRDLYCVARIANAKATRVARRSGASAK